MATNYFSTEYENKTSKITAQFTSENQLMILSIGEYEIHNYGEICVTKEEFDLFVDMVNNLHKTFRSRYSEIVSSTNPLDEKYEVKF